LLVFTDNKDRVIASLTLTLIDSDSSVLLADYVSRLKPFEQRKYLNAMITFAVKRYFSTDISQHTDIPVPVSGTVSGLAKFVHVLVKDSECLRDHLISILTRSVVPSLDDSLGARRGVLAALSQDEGKVQSRQYSIDRLTISRQITYAT
jgi:telomere length regulation protein